MVLLINHINEPMSSGILTSTLGVVQEIRSSPSQPVKPYDNFADQSSEDNVRSRSRLYYLYLGFRKDVHMPDLN